MHTKKTRDAISFIAVLVPIVLVLIISLIFLLYMKYGSLYEKRAFPAVSIDGIRVGGWTQEEIVSRFEEKNKTLSNTSITFVSLDYTATISGDILEIGYDSKLLSDQALTIGRTGSVLSDIYYRFITDTVSLPPHFIWNDEVLASVTAEFKRRIDIDPKSALFRFDGTKVSSFQVSRDGKSVDENELRSLFLTAIPHIATGQLTEVTIPVPVTVVKPDVQTADVNSYGIKELIGKGYSEFSGSIPGRIHNVALAAQKLNGVLIKPGEVFSFNGTVGDISAATGYQSAYVIKNGRTVMGDGGGVCQVSTTLFRAALDAGLPITERHEHSYRVHYYEDGGFKAGLDATVFDPTYDFKFRNDTPGHILIQTKTDTNNLTLTFELYGSSDGRKSQILNHTVWGSTPPPEPKYEDDPTLPIGVVKQVDFAAWGAKASFEYKVTRNGETILTDKFSSNYRPWQAVYLKGTKQ